MAMARMPSMSGRNRGSLGACSLRYPVSLAVTPPRQGVGGAARSRRGPLRGRAQVVGTGGPREVVREGASSASWAVAAERGHRTEGGGVRCATHAERAEGHV